MIFKKERNLIVAYSCNEFMGAWNITTGEFIGKRHKTVKNTPQGFTYDNLPDWCEREKHISYLYGCAVRLYRENMNDYRRVIYTQTIGNRFEQLLSVGLIPRSLSELLNNITLNKDIINFVKENCNGVYCKADVENFIIKKQYENYLNNLPSWAQQIFTYLMQSNIDFNYVKTAINRVINEHVNNFFDCEYTMINKISKIIQEYYDISMKIYDKVEVKRNFLTEYANLKYLHNEYKNIHYNEELKKNNDKPYLYFENEWFIARPILTKEEFHNEGESQHNCVERMYMEKVYNGETNIVVVRRKDSPNQSFITCEVKNERIIQYLERCNNHVNNVGAISFKVEYQKHLDNYKSNS